MDHKNIEAAEICKKCQGKCCQGCACSIGYFTGVKAGYKPSRVKDESDRLTPEERETIAAAKDIQVWKDNPLWENKMRLVRKFAKLVGATWDEKTGFQGPEGCTIPREKRSWVCRAYFCFELQKALKIDIKKYWADNS